MTTVKEKVIAYITHKERLLVFRHIGYPEAGIQVPAGTLKPSEEPAQGVLREAHEETGLKQLSVVRKLGVDDFDQRPYGFDEIHRRYFFHLDYDGDVEDRFIGYEKKSSEGEAQEIEFEFWWAAIPDEIPWLFAGHARYLPELCEELGLPVGELEYQAQFSISWTEANTAVFLERARYFVPEREHQIDLICDLVPDLKAPFTILDVGCGDGLLAQALLERHPQVTLLCYDGSWSMLRAARQRLRRFEARVNLRHFELTAEEWRDPKLELGMIVSSLALHHLTGHQKKVVFANFFEMLLSGGALVIADIIEPAGKHSRELAAKSWDDEVLRRALELDGNDRFYRDFHKQQWNIFRYPDEMDHPSGIHEQLNWLIEAGFEEVDVYWLLAGHAIFGGAKT